MGASRLIRFLPTGASSPRIGEPVDRALDVGQATYDGTPVEVELYSGSSVLDPGSATGETATVGRLLSPVTQQECGTIRCIGLNYMSHALEVKMQVPSVPTVFFKAAQALADPYPAPTVIPKTFLKDEAADYEAEVAVIVGRDAKDVPESEAWGYVGGITASNDVSSRKAQFATSQWSFSKSFDGAAPLGPVFVPRDSLQLDRIGDVTVKGIHNGNVVQSSNLADLIFDIPKIVAFLSQGSTLPKGTVIITGTPSGIGWSKNPKSLLKDGDEFRVEVSHGVGTLINKIVEEK